MSRCGSIAVTYKPRPIDVSGVKLPPDLEKLSEQLAENAHENWAALRIEQGWAYGPKRSDAQMLHPDLVPYEQLSESDKEYDRRSALDTLRVLLGMGYDIRPPKVGKLA